MGISSAIDFILAAAVQATGSEDQGKTQVLGWAAVLFLVGIPGALGGVLRFLAVFESYWLPQDSDKEDHTQSPRVEKIKDFVIRYQCGLLVAAFGGFGGSMAMLSLIVMSSKLPDDNGTSAHLMLLTLGLLGGFLGFTFLRSVAFKAEKQFAEQEARQERLEEKMGEVLKKRCKDRALVASEGKSTPESALRESISELSKLLQEAPDDREAAIILGNIHHRLGNNGQAVDVVDSAIKALRNKQETPETTKDIADLLYNRAFYNYARLKHEQRLNIQQNLEQAISENLEESFKLSSRNHDEALADPDFEGLWDRPPFQKWKK